MDATRETIEQVGTRIGKAIARDAIADDMNRQWTGLDDQDVDQIPDEYRDRICTVEAFARAAYEVAMKGAR